MARRILVIGSGAREHALAWRLARDADTIVRVAPGNDGMAREFERIALDPGDHDAVAGAAREAGVDLVVVGPEAPLAAGLADALEARGLAVFGPCRAAAALESSKAFAKEIMREAGVPTANAEVVGDAAAARTALARSRPPFVLKADGLAAGKGVCVTESREEAESFLAACLERGRFGEAGRRVLIEEFLAGEEASVIAVCDGERFVLLPAARDAKRAHDGDRGPNTGGMGAWAPVPQVDPDLEREIGERVVAPVLRALRARGTPFRGALYCGLMLGGAGPRVLEFNVRFGDPETQAVLPLLEGDLGALLASAAHGTLDGSAVRRAEGAVVAVALVDERYPDPPAGVGVIEGLERVGAPITVFHAGTRGGAGDRFEIHGGRAVTLMARGASVGAARERVYAAIAQLGGRGWRCRHDIAAGVTAAAAR